MVGARLFSCVIDLITMLILARLLSPADFGLVAIAMTVVLIVESVLELPIGQAPVCLPEIEESYCDTAFSLAVLRGVLLWAAICVIATPFAHFYHQPGLVRMIQVLGIAPAARGILIPGMAEFVKELNFRYEFIFELVGKIVAFSVGTVAAVLAHGYWSIALCTVTAPVIIVIQSCWLLPFRPKLTLAAWQVFREFLGWISLSQVVLDSA